MKRLLYTVLAVTSVASSLHGYKITIDSILPAIDVYVFKNENGWEEYLRNQQIPNDVISIAEKIQGYTQKGGALLKGVTQGESQKISGYIDKIVNAGKKLKETAEKYGVLQKVIATASIDAFYRNLKKGDVIEWNGNEIKSKLGVDAVYFVVIDPRYDKIVGQYKVNKDHAGKLIVSKTKYAEIVSTLE